MAMMAAGVTENECGTNTLTKGSTRAGDSLTVTKDGM